MERLDTMRCLCCGQPVTEGLSIRGGRLCPACEAGLTAARVGEPVYDRFVEAFRPLARGLLESASAFAFRVPSARP